MASQSKFAEVVHAAHKGKAIARATSPPTKRASPIEEVIMLPPPLPPPVVEESAQLWPESAALSTSASTSTSEFLGLPI